jgi:hypothetical protein
MAGLLGICGIEANHPSEIGNQSLLGLLGGVRILEQGIGGVVVIPLMGGAGVMEGLSAVVGMVMLIREGERLSVGCLRIILFVGNLLRYYCNAMLPVY